MTDRVRFPFDGQELVGTLVATNWHPGFGTERTQVTVAVDGDRYHVPAAETEAIQAI